MTDHTDNSLSASRTLPDYTLLPEQDLLQRLGILVLSTDVTLEGEFRHWFLPDTVNLHVSRIPSAPEIAIDSLDAMYADIGSAATLLPSDKTFTAVAYACTSGASVIGPERVAEVVRKQCDTQHVTDPLSALIQACERRGVKNLALLSPYVMDVSTRLRERLQAAHIDTPLFATFNEAREAHVLRIDDDSIVAATRELVAAGQMDGVDVDAVFLSCTNLRTRCILEPLSEQLGMPVLSSNSVLAEQLSLLLTQSN